MLTRLYIENVAVIEKISVEFTAGFNVLTGETGAGKSIIIESINAVLGTRTSKELVRTGAKKALISAVFEPIPDSTAAVLERLGFSCEDGQLLLSRELTADGRNTCKVCGMPATVSMLREIGQTLLDIHGQNDNHLLLSVDQHLHILDSFGDLAPLLADYRTNYEKGLAIKKELSALSTDEAEKNRRLDLLGFQIKELEAAALTPGEEEELLAKRDIYKNSEEIAENMAAARTLISGTDEGEGALSLLSSLSDVMENIKRYYPELERASGIVRDFYYELEELNGEIESLAEAVEFDPREQDRVESRLDQLFRLKKKYGNSVEEMLQYYDRISEEMNGIEHADERIAQLQEQRRQNLLVLKEKATRLSDARKKAAARFEKLLMEELTFLDMPSARFEIHIDNDHFGPNGADRVEFFISTNAGEPPKPMAKVASGGELARIMLSIENVLADHGGVGTMIFDEVDTGVSGRAGYKIGLKLRQVSRGRQVLCITHLAPIAALGQNHIRIEKQEKDGRTFTAALTLSGEERVREIARITTGENITEAALAGAREMLEAGCNIE